MSKSRETFNLGSSETVVPEGVVLWGVGGATPSQAENHEFTRQIWLWAWHKNRLSGFLHINGTV